MSFNYKPKIVLKNFAFEKFYEEYVSYSNEKEFKKFFQNSIEEDRKCQLCSTLIPLDEQIYGIPIGMRAINSELEVDIFGNYCSLPCSFKHYRNMEEDPKRRKNIKFIDSGQYFKCLFYKIFKTYNMEDNTQEFDLKSKQIKFKKIKQI